jgi:hypothetical protein
VTGRPSVPANRWWGNIPPIPYRRSQRGLGGGDRSLLRGLSASTISPKKASVRRTVRTIEVIIDLNDADDTSEDKQLGVVREAIRQKTQDLGPKIGSALEGGPRFRTGFPGTSFLEANLRGLGIAPSSAERRGI